MKDTDKMPFGKYQGQSLINVPASYLLWLNDNGLTHKELKTYITENMDVLKKEAKK